MTEAVQELRIRAEILQRRTSAVQSAPVRRRDCLALLARKLGFRNWPHAKRVLSGQPDSDFGGVLCPSRCGAHLNLWYKTHAEAVAARESRSGYLLAHRRHFLVVDRHYIETLGLDPDDPDWKALAFDWTHASPSAASARARFYAALVSAMPRDSAGH